MSSVRKSKKTRENSKKVYSMTGYGKASRPGQGFSLDVEIRTLNNRFLDINIKLPRVYAEFEMEVREVVSKSLQRGRIDVTVTRGVSSKVDIELNFRETAFNKLYKIYCEVAKKNKILDIAFKQRAISEILQRRDVLESAEEGISVKLERVFLQAALEEAIGGVRRMRAAEGERLIKDLTQRCMVLAALRDKIEKEAKGYLRKHRERLLQRISNLGNEIKLEPSRLEAEVALLLDRSDVTEELVRISSHLRAIDDIMTAGADGKKLEFLVQELGREFNTVGSKSAEANVTGFVVEAKSELERIREQVQNLE